MYKTTLVLFLFFITSSHAKDIKPIATLTVSGLVSDFVEDNGILYVATDAGVLDVIDLYTQKTVSQIHFEPLTTVRGDKVPARVHSVDRYQGKTLLVTSNISGYRNVWIHDSKKPIKKRLSKIIGEKKKLMPKRAYFTADGKIVLGTMDSDIVLYDNNEAYSVYNSHISESAMGGMALSVDKKKMVISDESGTVRLIDINSSAIEKTFSSEHVDNIYSVAYAKDIILTAGQDKRVGIYKKDNSFHIKSDFLVYCVGISPSAKIGAYSSDLENNLQLFSTSDGRKTDRLIGHFSTPTKILFTSENTIVSAGDEYTIYFWLLDK